MWRKRASLTPGEAASKRRVYIFALCVLFSALFWLFIKLTQESGATFNKHILFTDLPEGLILASQSDSIFDYRVETTGLRLFNPYFFGPTDTLYVSVNNMSVVRQQDKKFYVVTDIQLHELLSEKTGSFTAISQIKPDSVFLELVPAVRKKLPVHLNADIRFAQRFHPYGPISIEPDSVWITGPKRIIDTLEYLPTKFWESGHLRETARMIIELQKPVSMASFVLSRRDVVVKVPVSEYTESSIQLPLVINCPEEHAAAEVRLFPATVSVNYLVALHDYASVVPDMFQATVICPQVQQTDDGRLEVMITKYPPFINIHAINPTFVEYIILE